MEFSWCMKCCRVRPNNRKQWLQHSTAQHGDDWNFWKTWNSLEFQTRNKSKPNTWTAHDVTTCEIAATTKNPFYSPKWWIPCLAQNFMTTEFVSFRYVLFCFVWFLDLKCGFICEMIYREYVFRHFKNLIIYVGSFCWFERYVQQHQQHYAALCTCIWAVSLWDSAFICSRYFDVLSTAH